MLGIVVVQAEFEDSLGKFQNVGRCVTELQIWDCGGGDPVWFSAAGSRSTASQNHVVRYIGPKAKKNPAKYLTYRDFRW